MNISLQPQLKSESVRRQAAMIVADDTQPPLAHLLALASQILRTEEAAIFRVGAGQTLEFLEGKETERLRARAAACLASQQGAGICAGDACRETALLLGAEEEPVGLWTATVPEGAEQEWQELSDVLAPFFRIALRQTLWQREVTAAQGQLDRRIREVATVYDIGQAMDKIEIDRLLEMVTEKAAAVMEAQACSLLLKLPDSDALVIAASFGLPDDVVENARIFVGSSIAGHVVETGRELLLNSLEDDPRFRDSDIHSIPNISSSICMPMKNENGEVQGVLCIRRSSASPLFNLEDVKLFSIFATQAGLAINNAQLYAKLNHKLQELSTLAALTETITSTLDLDQVLNQVADNIVEVVHFDRCRIYLLDMETGCFSAHIRRGFRRSETEDGGESIEMGEGVIGLVAQRQMPILVEDITQTLPMLREYGQMLEMDAFYAQPIVARGRCIGVVVVSNTGPQRPIARADIESAFHVRASSRDRH